MLGVSTRRVDDLVRTLGIEGISRSEVSRICAALDAEVAAFRGRSLAGEAYPYVWLDATYLKVREAGPGGVDGGPRRDRRRDLGRAADPGPRASPGQRRGLGLAGASSARSSSAASRGVRLVISDDHAGLVKAVREQLLGSGWQRCRVHFTRNAQDLVPRSARSMVASAIRAVFEQPDEASARDECSRVIATLEPRMPAVARLLADAEPDLLAHFTFPELHRSRIRSTNPQERLNKEIKRRTAVVGIFPNRAERHPSRRHGPRRAGRRVAGRPALLPARVDGARSTPSSNPKEVGPALLMAS